MNTKRPAAFIILTLIVCGMVHAQETIMNDLSYLYMEKLVAVAKENYPRVRSYDNRIDIAKNNLASQKVSWLDPFSFSYYYRSNNNAIDIVNPALLTGYQIGVTVNPGTFLKKPFAIKAAKEELKIAESDQQEYGLQLEAEVKRRYLVYIQNLNTLRLQTKAVLDADNIFQDIKTRYEKAEVTFQQYNDASLALNNALQGKIAAEANMIMAKVSLEEMLTKKLEEIK